MSESRKSRLSRARCAAIAVAVVAARLLRRQRLEPRARQWPAALQRRPAGEGVTADLLPGRLRGCTARGRSLPRYGDRAADRREPAQQLVPHRHLAAEPLVERGFAGDRCLDFLRRWQHLGARQRAVLLALCRRQQRQRRRLRPRQQRLGVDRTEWRRLCPRARLHRRCIRACFGERDAGVAVDRRGRQLDAADRTHSGRRGLLQRQGLHHRGSDE